MFSRKETLGFSPLFGWEDLFVGRLWKEETWEEQRADKVKSEHTQNSLTPQAHNNTTQHKRKRRPERRDMELFSSESNLSLALYKMV